MRYIYIRKVESRCATPPYIRLGKRMERAYGSSLVCHPSQRAVVKEREKSGVS